MQYLCIYDVRIVHVVIFDMLHSHDPFVNSGREFDAGLLNKGRRGLWAVSDDFESWRS